jgi:hypothetical protein
MKENKTYSLSVPNVPYDYFNDFVRGYFDGDGHVWVGQINKERNTPHLVIQTVFTSCSQKFLEGLQNRLDKLAINKGRLSKGKGNYYRLVFSINGSLKLYNFMYNVKTSQKLFLYRKKRIFEKYKRMRA